MVTAYGREQMTSGFRSLAGVVVSLALLWIAAIVLAAQPQAGNAVAAFDADDIGGVVTSANGPEAGVWVIAETRELPTRFAKIVVTNERGQYLIPDLPKANYDVWVRGYGLVDSPRVKASPGKVLALMKTGDIYGSCMTCHQLGDKATREIPKELGTFANSREAWQRRIQSGQAGADMVKMFSFMGMQRTVALFADWTDRIAAGEVPPAPPRPSGVERNIVITEWNWGDEKTYLHDLAVTDRRNPTVNANGLVYSSPEMSTENTPVLDPATSKTSTLAVPPQDPKTPAAAGPNLKPSTYFGDNLLWTSRSDVHNSMFDGQGRLWMSARIRPPATPVWCRTGSSHPSAKRFPINEAVRQAAMYDPKTKKLSYIDLCFHAHHLMFAEDANNTLWFN